MKDYLSIGSSPSGETCAQLGSDGYHELMRKETKAFINQLKRQFGEPPAYARIVTKGFPHDFGTYHEVCVVFMDHDDEACEFAYKVEAETPEYWDEEAKRELGLIPDYTI